jgi:hypothetical protein
MPMTDDVKQPRIRARLTNDTTDFPHNDIANAALYMRERLSKAFEDKDRGDGIFLDMIAMVTMVAFALEGYVNFVGMTLIERSATDKGSAAASWSDCERKSTKDKIKALRKMTGVDIDWNKRPYATIGELNEIRNMFAHPKPHKPKVREWEAVGTDAEFRKQLRDYRPEYEERLTWEFCTRAYDDVEAIWQHLLEAAKINLIDALSGGSQGFELLAWVDENGGETKA